MGSGSFWSLIFRYWHLGEEMAVDALGLDIYCRGVRAHSD